MNGMQWLATWEQIEAPGRHAKRYPASFAHGYQFVPTLCPEIRQGRRSAGYQTQAIPQIIHAEYKVSGTGATWDKSPQVKFWLDEPKKTLAERIKAWLVKPAGEVRGGRAR